MAVKIRIPEALRSMTSGADVVEVEAVTVREMLEALDRKHPGIRARICDEAGNLRRFVNVFVSEEDIRFLQNLETPLSSGTEVSILPAIAGGASARVQPKRKGADERLVRRVYLTFVKDLVTKPIIYELIKKFDVIPNIRGASVTDEIGILSLEIEGREPDLDEAFRWLRKTGVKVDPIEMNVVEP